LCCLFNCNDTDVEQIRENQSLNQVQTGCLDQWDVYNQTVKGRAQRSHAHEPLIKLEKVVERISGWKLIEMLFQDSILTNVTRALKVTMVNKLRVDSFDLVDGLDDNHWSVEVFALHRITAPRNDLIGSVMGMSRDQVNQHDLNVERDGAKARKDVLNPA
jgi:hypothetical protein